MRVVRSVFFTTFVLALSACATEVGLFPNILNSKCVAESDKKQSPVNWKQAKILNIAIRDGVYDPDRTYMKVGEPTILRIANNDNTPRYFLDSEFLDSVALAQVSVGGAKYDRPCISGVVIAAGNTTELRFVPQTAGVYFPASDLSWFLGIRPDAGGMIFVDG